MAHQRAVGRAERIAAVVLLAACALWVAYAVLGDFDTIGRHFIALAVLRVAMLALLFAIARTASARSSGLGRTGLALAAAGAALFLVGALGAVATDGWNFNPLGTAAEARSDASLWYAYAIGMGFFLFTIGVVLVGIAARSVGWPAAVLILTAVVHVASSPWPLAAHLLWVTGWMVVAGALAAMPPGNRGGGEPALSNGAA